MARGEFIQWNLKPGWTRQGVHDPGHLFFGDLRVHCRLFPTTLKGTTFEWYYSLPRNSVDSFLTLYLKFMAQFIDNKLMTTSSASLHHVTQRKNESLKQYMTCFAKACLNIPNLHPTVAMRTSIVGLKSDLFLNALFVEPPSNMDKLLAHAAKYITIEENIEAARRTETPMMTSVPKRKRSIGLTPTHYSTPARMW